MKINKELFIKKLEAVKPGLSNKEIIEFSNSFGFSENSIITYNDFICVKCPIELDFKGTVVADNFYKFINQAKPDKEGNIEITVEENNILIKANKAKAGIPINLEGAISLEELGKIPNKWSKLPGNFLAGIKLSKFSVSNDASQPILTCLNIKDERIESSNGDRAFRFKLEEKMKTAFLLPSFSIHAILNHPITKYCVSENWIHFKTKDDIIISSRMYAETEFPDMDFLFNIKGQKIELPIKLNDVLDRAIIFCGQDDDSENVTINITKKVMIVSSESDSGWFKETVPMKSEKEVEFKINPFFLKDILKDTMKAILHQGKERSLLKFSSDNWEYVIAIQVN